jgi:peptide/nickel transport system ATP-binding protein
MLDIQNLKISFTDARGGETVHGIDLHMEPGERLGLVGESGCGKTITALTIAGLIPRGRTAVSGRILFEGRDLLECSRKELRRIQGRDIGMIFQEPMTSLNPLMRIGPQIEETLRIHTDLPRARRRELALEVMEKVDLPDPARTYDKYPHQLSGGQRQRAMIAAAFIADPKLLIADEPTTALDVTVQAQILALLRRINEKRNVGILFISHDLNVVRRLCTRVAVMMDGRIVEQGPAEAIFQNPQNDYTRRLIAAIPGRRKRGV